VPALVPALVPAGPAADFGLVDCDALGAARTIATPATSATITVAITPLMTRLLGNA
jgi:hypothetical protein